MSKNLHTVWIGLQPPAKKPFHRMKTVFLVVFPLLSPVAVVVLAAVAAVVVVVAVHCGCYCR